MTTGVYCILVVVVPIRLSDSEILFQLPLNTFNIVSRVTVTTAELQWPRLKVLMTQPRLYSYRVVCKAPSRLTPRSSLLAQFYRLECWRQFWLLRAESEAIIYYFCQDLAWPGSQQAEGEPPNIVCNVSMLPRPGTHPCMSLNESNTELRNFTARWQPSVLTTPNMLLTSSTNCLAALWSTSTIPHPHPLRLMGH